MAIEPLQTPEGQNTKFSNSSVLFAQTGDILPTALIFSFCLPAFFSTISKHVPHTYLSRVISNSVGSKHSLSQTKALVSFSYSPTLGQQRIVHSKPHDLAPDLQGMKGPTYSVDAASSWICLFMEQSQGTEYHRSILGAVGSLTCNLCRLRYRV